MASTNKLLDKAFELLNKIFGDDPMEDEFALSVSDKECVIKLPVGVSLAAIAKEQDLDYKFVGNAVEIHFTV